MKEICLRMMDLDIVQQGYFKQLMAHFKKQGWDEKEPGVQIPVEKAHAFQQMIFHALGEDYIGEAKASEPLCCSLDKLKSLRLVN